MDRRYGIGIGPDVAASTKRGTFFFWGTQRRM
jgi:hypothetical protein